jgi:multicomponent Na+:H+ antiporter subunit D
VNLNPAVFPLLAVGIPIAAVIPILLCSRWPNLREAWSLIASVATAAAVLSMLSGTLAGQPAEAVLFDLAPGVAVALRADAAGMLFALLASGLWVLTTVYSIGYMRTLEEGRQTRYYCAFALSLSTAIGVALSANLITFVLFYELLTLATYPLVTHHEDEDSVRAGRKYLVYTLSAGLALIAASAWLLSLGIDGTFEAGGFLQELSDQPGVLWGLFVLLATGVGVKAAVMPLHSWLPSAMVAPTPVSALLHAVAVVKAGAFGFVRVMGFVFGPVLLAEMGAAQVVAVFAAVTLTLGSILAIRMDHLKQRLAYSTISHLSYIVLGTAILTPAAWVGALFHMVAHGITKITLFFCAGAIQAKAHKHYVSQLNGIGWQMPYTMTAFALASLGMAGLPPFMMFASKWFLGSGAVAANMGPFLAVYILSGVLNAAYLFPIVFRAFVLAPDTGSDVHEVGEASRLMVVPLMITGVLALVLGVFPDLGFSFLQLATAVALAVTGSNP